MRILFIITVRGHGRGGHFHSLNHISNALSKEVEVGICTYGTGNSNVLENNPYFKKHIYYNGKNLYRFQKETHALLLEYQPDILHFFDVSGFVTFNTFIRIKKFNIFLSKCGGPNPTEFPTVNNLILFSEENKKWFDSQNKFNKINIRVIPNRVNPELLKFNFIKSIKKKEAFCFVRIARIGIAYKKSILDSIRLVGELAKDGQNVHLYIIGAVQDNKILDELRVKIKGIPVTLLTDDQFTQKASDMLYLADAVIATGRGIMEATSLGKPILTPAKNSELPILVNSDNFKQFFETNFSERNIASSKCLQSNLALVHQLVEDRTFFKKMSHYSNNVFNENFSTDGGVQKYLDFYNSFNSDTVRMNKWSDFLFKLKTWYSFTK